MYVSFDDGDDWQSLMLRLAQHIVSRHHRQGQRSGRRDVWTEHLDPRRHLAAAAADRRRWRAEPVHLFKPGDAIRRAAQHQHRDAVPARDAARRQSARGRRDLLQPGASAHHIALDVLDAAGRDSPALLERPDSADSRTATAGARRMDLSCPSRCRPPPGCTGSTGTCATTCRRRSSTTWRTSPARYRGDTHWGGEGPVGASRHLHAAIQRRRQGGIPRPCTVKNDPNSTGHAGRPRRRCTICR